MVFRFMVVIVLHGLNTVLNIQQRNWDAKLFSQFSKEGSRATVQMLNDAVIPRHEGSVGQQYKTFGRSLLRRDDNKTRHQY